MFLWDFSLRRDSPRKARRDLEPKLSKMCLAWRFLLLCCGEGEGEAGVLGAWVECSLTSSDSDSEPEYSTNRPLSSLLSLAAQVPWGLLLSPGETLTGLAEVCVGLDGLYGESGLAESDLEGLLGGKGVTTTSDGRGPPVSPPVVLVVLLEVVVAVE